MSHRSDFTISLTPGVRMGMCDVCAEVMPNETDRYQTFVGGTPVSEICVDCATYLARLVGENKRARKLEKTLDLSPIVEPVTAA